MSNQVVRVQPEEVRSFRDLYRAEMSCQIIHYSWWERGWTDAYMFRSEGRLAGYGLVGGVRGDPKDTVIEFYVLPAYRSASLALFRDLAAASGAASVEAQTNDLLLTLMLFDCAARIESSKILFHDAGPTRLVSPGATFRRTTGADAGRFPGHSGDPPGEWLIEVGGEIAATGGILFHYNVPYGDIYMEVAERFRRQGYGSYLVQELKRTCYEMGRIPAARCSVTNIASRATLQRAGMLPCARLLTGTLSG